MKKAYIFFFITVSSFSAFAQEEKTREIQALIGGSISSSSCGLGSYMEQTSESQAAMLNTYYGSTSYKGGERESGTAPGIDIQYRYFFPSGFGFGGSFGGEFCSLGVETSGGTAYGETKMVVSAYKFGLDLYYMIPLEDRKYRFIFGAGVDFYPSAAIDEDQNIYGTAGTKLSSSYTAWVDGSGAGAHVKAEFQVKFDAFLLSAGLFARTASLSSFSNEETGEALKDKNGEDVTLSIRGAGVYVLVGYAY